MTLSFGLAVHHRPRGGALLPMYVTRHTVYLAGNDSVRPLQNAPFEVSAYLPNLRVAFGFQSSKYSIYSCG